MHMYKNNIPNIRLNISENKFEMIKYVFLCAFLFIIQYL